MKLLLKLYFLIMLCSSGVAYSQSCSCTEFKQLHQLQLGDSVIANKMVASASIICKAKGFTINGILKIDEGKLDEAETLLKQAETLYKTTTCSDSLLIDVYGNLSDVYYRNGNYPLAQEYSLKLLHAAEKSNNVYQLAISNTMVAQLFFEINQTDDAVKYIQTAAALLEKIINNNEKKMLLYALHKRYLWHYDKVKNDRSLDTSALYCSTLLALAKQTQDDNNIARAYNGLQEVEYERGNLNKALNLLDSATKYIDKKNYPDLRIIYSDRADILLLQKKYNEALKYADSTLALDKFTGNSADMADSYLLFTKIYKAMNDYKKAFEYNELGKNIIDSINNIKSSTGVAELEKKYNQQKNELTIKELHQKKQLYLFLSLFALCCVAIVVLFYRQKTLKQKKNTLEIEQRLNRARMNPHFFFNSLTALQKIALQQTNGMAMAASLSKYSKLMRATLESTYKEYTSIEDEIEFLQEYLTVQQTRFEAPFSYEVIAADDVEIDDIFIPSMIIQPFIENTLEHGFSNINYTGSVEVTFKKENNYLQITIADNGKGLTKTLKTTEHISRATQIIKDRIYLLNIKHKAKASYTINDNINRHGATVIITLPILHQQNIYENSNS